MTILIYTDIARNIAQKLHIDNIIKDFYMGYDYNGDKTKAIMHTHNGKKVTLSSFHNTMSTTESIVYQKVRKATTIKALLRRGLMRTIVIV